MSGVAKSAVHQWAVRVYYDDTDAGGVVYHANYLKFAERARTEWLRAMGLEQASLRESDGVIIVVRRCVVDFLRPARLDDALVVESRVVAVGGASLDLRQEVTKNGAVLAGLDVRLACMDERGRATRLPQSVRDRFDQAAGTVRTL